MHKTKSVTVQNDLLVKTTVSASIMIFITITSVIASYFYLENNASQTSETLKAVNDLVLTIQSSPDSNTDDTTNSYNEVISILQKSSNFVGLKTNLPPPLYQNSAESLNYRESIRIFAARIRFNESQVRKWNHIINLGLLCISLFALIFLVTMTQKNRRVFLTFLGEVERGIESIHDLLQFKTVAATNEIHSKFPELEDLFQHIQRVSSLISLDHSMVKLSGYGNMSFLIDFLSQTISQYMPCDRIALAFMTSDSMVTAETAHTKYAEIQLVPGYSEHIDKTSLRKVVISQSPRIINDLNHYASNKTVSNATTLLIKEGINASITAPLMYQDTCVGFLFVNTRERIGYTNEHALELMRISSALRQTLYMEYLFQKTVSEAASAFVSLMNEKDNETSLHLTRMAQYSYSIARKYNLSVKRLEPSLMREILWFSPLHDIGKIGIPDSILHKPGPLTKEERTVMEKHVDIGERVISTMDRRLKETLSHSLLLTAIDIIAGHHEKFNGTGYPRSLSGDDIPIAGRIAAAADVFDALTTRRPYKEAYSIEQAISIMQTEMTGHFDPDILECLTSSLDEITDIYDKFKEV